MIWLNVAVTGVLASEVSFASTHYFAVDPPLILVFPPLVDVPLRWQRKPGQVGARLAVVQTKKTEILSDDCTSQIVPSE